jgi:hypothetical protein
LVKKRRWYQIPNTLLDEFSMQDFSEIFMWRMVTDDSAAAGRRGKDEIEWEQDYEYHFPDETKFSQLLSPFTPSLGSNLM